MNNTEIIEALRGRLSVPTGRHLYGIIGAYAALQTFAEKLHEAKTPSGKRFPKPISANRGILDAIPDDEFRQLVADEAKRPEPTTAHVARAFESFLRSSLRGKGLVVLADLELVFAYDLELSLLRSMAADDDQVLLLLPGRRDHGKVLLFTECDDRTYALPTNLIAENHLWELKD
jgi:hypothetical protein